MADNRINIVIAADIEELQQGLKDAVKAIGTSGKQINSETEAVIKGIEDDFARISNSKNTKRVVSQLQNLALKVEALGPEFQGMANKIIQSAGEMKDKIGDVGAQITYFSSDTRRFDAVISGVEGITSAFNVFQGVVALTGKEDENLQKSLQKLAAGMAIVQGLQSIQNVLQAESALMTGINALAQKGLAVALNEVKVALLANPYTVAAVAIAALAAAVYLYTSRTTEAEKAAKRHAEYQNKINEAVGEAVGQSQAQAEQIDYYRKVVNDTTKSEKVRIAALTELKSLGIDVSSVNLSNKKSLSDLNAEIDSNIKLIRAKAIADAYSNLVAEKQVELSKIKLSKAYQTSANMLKYYNSVLQNNRNALNESEISNGANLAITKLQASMASKTAEAEKQLNMVLDLQTQSMQDLLDVKSGMKSTDDEYLKNIKAQTAAEDKKWQTIQKGLNDAIASAQKWKNQDVAAGGAEAEKEKAAAKNQYLANQEAIRQKEEVDNAKKFAADMIEADGAFADWNNKNTEQIDQANRDKVNSMAAYLAANAAMLKAKADQNRQAQEEEAKYLAENAKFTETFNQQFSQLQSDTLVQFGQNIADALINGSNAMNSIFNTILTSVANFAETYGKALIAAAVASEAFQKLLIANPVLAIGAGIALVATASVVKSVASKGVTAFAEGGVISGPTLGLMGEYAGASTNPEVVAPLDKLQKLIQPAASSIGAVPYIAETRISGSDLQIILKRQERNNLRG